MVTVIVSAHTVPPNVVVHELAPHVGARTNCEYIE